MEAKPKAVSWTQLANNMEKEEKEEKEMKKKAKSSSGSSWAELAAGSFELLDPYRVKLGGLGEQEELESLRSLGDAANPFKASGFRCSLQLAC